MRPGWVLIDQGEGEKEREGRTEDALATRDAFHGRLSLLPCPAFPYTAITCLIEACSEILPPKAHIHEASLVWVDCPPSSQYNSQTAVRYIVF